MVIRKLRELFKTVKELASKNPTILKFIQHWKKYFDKTTIHGLRFLFRSKITRYERKAFLIIHWNEMK